MRLCDASVATLAILRAKSKSKFVAVAGKTEEVYPVRWAVSVKGVSVPVDYQGYQCVVVSNLAGTPRSNSPDLQVMSLPLDAARSSAMHTDG